MFEGDFFEKIRRMVEEMERKGEGETLEAQPPKAPQARIRKSEVAGELEEIKGTLETDYLCLEKPREIIFCMRVPGVEKRGIKIKRRGRAVEILAKREDGKAYFATFELPLGAIPEEKILKMRGGNLLLFIPKRKRN